LVTAEIKDPSAFARTALIEALQRAGVAVTAPSTGPNPASILPPAGSYQAGDKLSEHVSASLEQLASLTMKVSYNRAADLMTCLSAVKAGSTDCQAGLAADAETMNQLGLPKDGVYAFDGAGSNDQNRSTPTALAMFYQAATKQPWGKSLSDALPVMGRTGSVANVLPKSPAAGKVRVKTGNRVVGTGSNQLIVLGNSLAGYIHTKSGRDVTFMIVVANVPISSTDEFLNVTDDQARMIEILQKGL
jgi:D-alanyl-D-alanine carboxypeptidase/D-alanyl-D-alanine-endopeptidase (penicillin-binding protein 4)